MQMHMHLQQLSVQRSLLSCQQLHVSGWHPPPQAMCSKVGHCMQGILTWG